MDGGLIFSLPEFKSRVLFLVPESRKRRRMSLTFWGNLGYSRTHLYSIDATCFQRRSVVAKALLTELRMDIMLAGDKPKGTGEVTKMWYSATSPLPPPRIDF